MRTKAIFLLSLAMLCANCSQNLEEETVEPNALEGLNLPDSWYNYANPDLPDHFLDNDIRRIDNTPTNNQITNAGATLGRVLFYDVQLSANNTVSCASCHMQAKGFSDSRTRSLGFEGEETGRNSMGLANARYYNNGSFFWDERATSLEAQVLMPIQDEVEMGLTLDELVAKVQAQPYYEPLFFDAFGSSAVTADRIANALAQFVRAMVSYQAPYDFGLVAANGNSNARFSNFTELENLGKDLFFSRRTQCSNCHETVAFSGDRARNNGLNANSTDLGLGAVTGNQRDNGKFKVNSLRNIELTSPYMHDGRFETLEEVIDFYNRGVQNHPNLDDRLREGNNRAIRMNLNAEEQQALVAFLRTLTDQSFISDEKFSNPFGND
ncbi:cytochrome c peroxidase [uncultured Roseivirga sp.]|uniref:cytochrome-c peroxidase n=1 Tax=uncultured Roseivirga sp. TaxID=543088 RepID=UPI0025885115|nr:cytochrome c peroxidase [uncultured Roseivirga sp.]|tara:strand:+ start:992 stop:2134 length:1143 start_codon:yes stop_codon:yes gene_type:complete